MGLMDQTPPPAGSRRCQGLRRRGKNFPVLRLRQEKFFRPLTSARFCDTLMDWGNVSAFPPSPFGAEG